MPTLSLCMIVKNEEEVISRCLDSVQSLVDEIIIVDTGSSDHTVQLCAAHGAQIFHFEWRDDFAKARNFSFEQAGCDYILWLDADDVVEPGQLLLLKELKDNLNHDVYFLKYDYSQDEYGASACTLFRERIIKNDGNFRWIYPVHEVIDGTNNRSSSYQQITIKHLRTAAGAANDHGRNLNILARAANTSEYHDSPRIWYYYGKELFDHRDFTTALSAFGRFTEMPGGWIEDKVGAYIKMAQCYLQCHQMEPDKETHLLKAREMARMAIQLDNRWAEPYFIMGEAAFILQQIDEAVFWFKKCLIPIPDVLSPVNRAVYGIDAYVKLMFCLDKLQDYEQANHYNELALQCKPADAGLLYNSKYFQSRLYGADDRGYAIAWYGKNIDPNFPTYRIRALQMNAALAKLGFYSEMVDKQEELARFNAVIFFKGINETEFNVMQAAKRNGKRVVFDIAEDLFDHTANFPFYIPMLQLADVITCCSYILAEKIKPYNANVVVVEDAVEPVQTISSVTEKQRLVFGWIGMPENARHAEKLRPLIEAAGCELLTIHSGADCNRRWAADNWQTTLAQCDAAIAPLDVAAQPAKSNNKITTYQSLGLPVIASPLDAYMRIIVQGENGFLASSDDEWRAGIEQLKDISLRQKLHQNGIATARTYRPERMAMKMTRAISQKDFDARAVDIIIPTIYPTQHLELCVNSIIACTDVPYNIIVVNNGAHELHLPEEVTIIKGDNWNYSASINAGIRHGQAPFICMMNDDVIVSEGWLPPLLNAVKNGIHICNPLSNCDYGSLHIYNMEADGVMLGAGTNILSGGYIVNKVTGAGGLSPASLHTYRPDCERRQYLLEWVPFYCTLLSRDTIEKTGQLDDGFDNGCEDVDFCRRAKQMGYTSGVNEESFVFHFGGTSTGKFILENPEQEGATHRAFREKYARPLFVVHAGLSYESWNGHTIQNTGIGGSETAVVKMAEAFSRRGYRCIVFCECGGMEGVINDVEYKPLQAFENFIDRHFIDVFVVSRYANFLTSHVRAQQVYFWVHDVWAMGTQTGENDLLRKYIDKVNGVFCLSPWHRDLIHQTHGIPYEKLIVTGNGIDLNRFTGATAKVANRFIYSSSPDRSLDIVLRLFPAIRSVFPDASLHIYYGFDNWNKSIDQTDNAEKRLQRDTIYKLMEQEGVYYHGRVNQHELARAFEESDIWLYPTQFTETYCITALEAQMSGTLCICSDLAGLCSTVADRGILIQKDAWSPDYEAHIIALLCDIQSHPERKQVMIQRARQWAREQSWDNIAAQWAAIFSPSVKVDQIRIQEQVV